ncbi:uncharacterized protein KGF55_000412 [Candida pseudojiufengensis]|uniref:uncharacterized protein n=1 Tax=Candida pseudojiufengensis TaxID=497109 RepID=UPI002224ABEA|nr:uncharacterized protein KGF55_000412 [Candida pseudojiufengensis]KAI5967003.1 hypothetical protein KGF55_000412 [Candida pseudojiufengensis]
MANRFTNSRKRYSTKSSSNKRYSSKLGGVKRPKVIENEFEKVKRKKREYNSTHKDYLVKPDIFLFFGYPDIDSIYINIVIDQMAMAFINNYRTLKYFDDYTIAEIAKCFVVGPALNWVEQYFKDATALKALERVGEEMEREANGLPKQKPEIKYNMNKFIEDFEKKFKREDHEERIIIELDRLKQGNSTLEEYKLRFFNLVDLLDRSEKERVESSIVNCFKRNVHSRYTPVVSSFTTLEQIGDYHVIEPFHYDSD